ncbi:hypothetical protein BDC45DRAFT_578936 [Circinella umbellata]|nr:hypothetical protein BDC45DRAFT_578936 [Circinella umbellata]
MTASEQNISSPNNHSYFINTPVRKWRLKDATESFERRYGDNAQSMLTHVLGKLSESTLVRSKSEQAKKMLKELEKILKVSRGRKNEDEEFERSGSEDYMPQRKKRVYVHIDDEDDESDRLNQCAEMNDKVRINSYILNHLFDYRRESRGLVVTQIHRELIPARILNSGMMSDEV